jgi:signal transduction histidine kinase
MRAAQRPVLRDGSAHRMATTAFRLSLLLIVAMFIVVVVALAVATGSRIPLAMVVGGGALAAVAAVALALWLFRAVQDGEQRLVARNRQMAAVQLAATSLSTESELRAILHRTVELSREITGAQYGAMAVRNPDGSIAEFITSGIADEARERIGDPPIGIGLLGAIINDSTALRLAHLTADSRAAGFPPHHPPMQSLLGVPVVWKGITIGNLYLTDKVHGDAFSEDDEEMLRIFAAHAAVAVENARMQGELRALAVLRERERIGMDLHDGIIQSIYAVGLGLESVAEDISDEPRLAREGLETAIEHLNGVIRDVRSYIFELRPARLTEDLGASLANLVEDFRVNSLIEAAAQIAEPLPALSETQRLGLFHVAKEALVNARKHANATSVNLSLDAIDGMIQMHVRDNGRGFDLSPGLSAEHRGLLNMASRAREAGGTLSVESTPGSGTTVTMVIGTDAEVEYDADPDR